MKSHHKIILVVVILLFITGFAYLYAKEGTLPVNKNDTATKIFVVERGAKINTIVKNLASEGLIRNKIIFWLLIKKVGLEKNIQAGDFRLSPSWDAYKIIDTLSHGTLDSWVTIIEGMRKEEVAQVVSADLGIPEVQFVTIAKEGYVFPDTYLIPKEATAESLLKIIQNNFDNQYKKAMKGADSVHNLTKDEIVTLASIVEREARTDTSRQAVASILLKRLRSDIPLQVDATIQYALGYQDQEKDWWKKEISFDDLKIDSPYNTYKNKGLPPGPICSPSLSSLIAVFEADQNTPYLFYISDKKGAMHYGKTGEEHQANIDKYLQ